MSESPRFRATLEPNTAPSLGPEIRPGTKTPAEVEQWLTQHPASGGLNPEERLLAQAALLIWHDRLDPAHALVQDLTGADAAYLHGIIHRREPDYWNARYWFRRAGRARIVSPLAEAAHRLLQGTRGEDWHGRLLPAAGWDAVAFVDLCETAAGLKPAHHLHQLALELQTAELHIWVQSLLHSH